YGAFVAKKYQFSWGDLAINGLVGAGSGLLGFGAGKALGFLGSKLIKTGLGKAATGLLSKAATGAKNLASQGLNAAKGFTKSAFSSARNVISKGLTTAKTAFTSASNSVRYALGRVAPLRNNALVVRGGSNTTAQFAKASGATLDAAGKLQGVSV